MSEEFRTFEDFWPHYVREHAHPVTRWMHFAGTGAALVCLAAFARTRKAWLIPTALVAGYGPAWASHFFVEKNRPATFQHPLWSLRADFRMFGLMLRGQMDAEVARATAPAPSDAPPAHAETHVEHSPATQDALAN
jgi:hypothetical protein